MQKRSVLHRTSLLQTGCFLIYAPNQANKGGIVTMRRFFVVTLLSFSMGASNTSASVLDVDGDGSVDALTDGLLVIRYVFGLRGQSLISNAVATGCSRCTPSPVEAYLASLVMPDFRHPLNDTGITSCADDSNNGLSCPVSGYPGQDAEYGRDATDNDDSDGHAGFSFTKLDANGNPLPASATSWSCVKDNITGLIWEAKTDDGGLHDKDDTYTWYTTDFTTNGGDPGDDGNNRSCHGYNSSDPATYCNTQAYVVRVNQAGWCGYNDWRMPTIKELENIVSRDGGSPAIDTDYFPNTHSSYYWSTLPNADYSYQAWYVSFGGGESTSGDKDYGKRVRLVRSGH